MVLPWPHYWSMGIATHAGFNQYKGCSIFEIGQNPLMAGTRYDNLQI